MIEWSSQAFVAAQIDSRRDDRFGSGATDLRYLRHVRLTPESDIDRPQAAPDTR